ILEGNSQLWTLLHLQYQKHVFAKDGEGGGENLRSGAQGEDIVLQVPLGTVARDAESGEQLLEITEHGQRLVLVPGGRGGWGNDHFKSPTNQAPDYAQPGEPSVEAQVILELKLLADVGLVGFPNAGKSTLLSVVSAAKPKIADYAFTTLTPNLGVVAYRDYKSFVMADIPGIIEGAAEGKGLGTRFLRHIERNSMLLFMISCDSPDIAAEYEILLGELREFNPELLEKKRLLAITKTDMIDEELEAEIRPTLPEEVPSVFISSLTNKNIAPLKDMIWKALHE
ncbi:MAG TPA: GTPase ObgE, partial [Hymenobacter sp.]